MGTRAEIAAAQAMAHRAAVMVSSTQHAAGLAGTCLSAARGWLLINQTDLLPHRIGVAKPLLLQRGNDTGVEVTEGVEVTKEGRSQKG